MTWFESFGVAVAIVLVLAVIIALFAAAVGPITRWADFCLSRFPNGVAGVVFFSPLLPLFVAALAVFAKYSGSS